MIGIQGNMAGICRRGENIMAREDVYDDIKATLGSVPGFIAALDDDHLAPMWEKTKNTFLSDMSLGLKENALATTAAAYALKCDY